MARDQASGMAGQGDRRPAVGTMVLADRVIPVAGVGPLMKEKVGVTRAFVRLTRVFYETP
ncbi:hypothetical protein LOK74_04230 [Brevibacillus humidisoli]|uniref:hypothetical protein n=1 Tax=Brevibacillus humidisoli TaxID=2895522 RepID=UPI001E347179|nr:hypothetical protein [Brevibacillus humidisoli]UFJ41726.1 hypothetical protein LOK74_04230 [Brevibacillus humidisoli]